MLFSFFGSHVLDFDRHQLLLDDFLAPLKDLEVVTHKGVEIIVHIDIAERKNEFMDFAGQRKQLSLDLLVRLFNHAELLLSGVLEDVAN